MANHAQVHRHHNMVALSLPGDGATVYLTPGEARRIGDLVLACADDIDAVRFVNSTFPCTEVPLIHPHRS